MVRHVETGFLAHGLYLADYLSLRSLEDELVVESGVQRDRGLAVGFRRISFPALDGDEQIFLREFDLSAVRLGGVRAGAPDRGDDLVGVLGEYLAYLAEQRAEFGTERLELGFELVADETVELDDLAGVLELTAELCFALEAVFEATDDFTDEAVVLPALADDFTDEAVLVGASCLADESVLAVPE